MPQSQFEDIIDRLPKIAEEARESDCMPMETPAQPLMADGDYFDVLRESESVGWFSYGPTGSRPSAEVSAIESRQRANCPLTLPPPTCGII